MNVCAIRGPSYPVSILVVDGQMAPEIRAVNGLPIWLLFPPGKRYLILSDARGPFFQETMTPSRGQDPRAKCGSIHLKRTSL